MLLFQKRFHSGIERVRIAEILGQKAASAGYRDGDELLACSQAGGVRR